MYYENYEDYMRSVLGYPVDRQQDTYEAYPEYARPVYEPLSYTPQPNDSTMELYPEIYRIVNPMVQKICEANTKPISRELVDAMTEEIFLNLEGEVEVQNIVNVRVNTPKATNSENGKKSKASEEEKTPRTTAIAETENREVRQSNRNSLLRDLIRILILNQLLGRRRPPRPPFPGPGNPPPRPPRPPVRPPFPREDRYYNNYLKF